MKTKLKCYECGHRFQRTLKRATVEVKCPKCKGYDTDLDYTLTKENNR